LAWTPAQVYHVQLGMVEHSVDRSQEGGQRFRFVFREMDDPGLIAVRRGLGLAPTAKEHGLPHRGRSSHRGRADLECCYIGFGAD